MRKNVFFLLFSFSSAVVFAQGNKAEYRENFVQGNYLLLEENFPLALNAFLAAYNIDSSSANINYKVGYCYLQSATEKEKAVYYLEKAVRNVSHNYNDTDPREKNAPEFAYYYLAQAYRLAYKFDESNAYFGKFKGIVGEKNKELAADLKKQIAVNTNAAVLVHDTVPVKIVNMGDSINSIYPDYSPVVSADESTIIFTSRRAGSSYGNKMDDNQFYEDIYFSTKKKDGTWTQAKSIGENINTTGGEANISLSADGQTLLVYRDVNGGDIYYSTLEGDTWSSLLPIDGNVNSPAWETHASISADGNTIYFVSNRKEGSMGGRDIWRCVKLPNGKWSAPFNVGAPINTEEDEEAPFLHPDGVTLFFASKGHKNMGGFDIFKSVINAEDGKWGEPENLKAPINTTDDDIFYVQSADGKRGYFSSLRKEGLGEKDIYMISFEKAQAEPLTILKGYLTVNGASKPPSNIQITVTDMETGLVVQDIKPNQSTGKYLLVLRPGVGGKTYNVSYEAPGFQPVSTNITIEPNSAYQEIEKELLLEPINFEKKEQGAVSLKGRLTNKSGAPIKGAKLIVKDNVSGDLVGTYYTSTDSGSYYFTLGRGKNYNISYEAEGFLFNSENISVPKESEYAVLTKNVVLEKVQVGAKIVLNNIFFDSNKATLRKESKLEIDKIIKLMKEYPDLTIEVSGHTDGKGSDAANLKLSQMRAQAVVNDLIKKGVDSKHLVAKGYGKTQPIASEVLKNGKPDLKGMQMNRRVEMKIVSPE